MVGCKPRQGLATNAEFPSQGSSSSEERADVSIGTPFHREYIIEKDSLYIKFSNKRRTTVSSENPK
jgi:hypothetical protein